MTTTPTRSESNHGRWYFSMLGGMWVKGSKRHTYESLGVLTGRIYDHRIPSNKTVLVMRGLHHDTLHGLARGTTLTVILDQLLGDMPREALERFVIFDIEDDGTLCIAFADGSSLRLAPGPIDEMRARLLALL